MRLAFSPLKSDLSRIVLASVQWEVAKLNWIRELDLPDGPWADTSPKLLERYPSRAAAERAEMVGELQRVDGKTALLFRIVEAALGNPDGVVREVLFLLVWDLRFAGAARTLALQGNLSRMHRPLLGLISSPPDVSPPRRWRRATPGQR